MKTLLKIIIILLFPCLAQAGVVKTIYFYPKDRTPQADINTTLDSNMKDAQSFFGAVQEGYGYSRKTFPLETGTNGKVVVHHVEGMLDDEDYLDDPFFKVKDELDDVFTSSDDIYFIAIDISETVLDVNFRGTDVEACGIAVSNWSATPAHGNCFNYTVIAHELAHNFGLDHDFRSSGNIDGMINNACSAAWLDKHPFFNGGNTDGGSTQISMLPTTTLT